MSLIVYKSSAGSGKTFTLVKEYLTLALRNSNTSGVKSILAMTFTNKAAAEMKTRVIQQLFEISQLSRTETSNMLEALLEDSKLKFNKEEIQERSRALLFQILHHYSQFAMSTIDRFNHRVIRSFASELGLSQNFEIELDTPEILEEAIENLITYSTKDKDLHDFLLHFTLERIADDKSWRVEQELFNHSKSILDEGVSQYLEPLASISLNDYKSIHKQLVRKVKLFENQVIELAKKAIDLIESKNIPISSFYFGNSGGLPSYFKKVSTGNILEKISSRSRTTLLENKWFSSKTPETDKAEIESIKVDLISLFEQIQNELEQGRESFILRRSILKNFYATVLINEVSKEFERIKTERNILPISDFNKLISQVVNEQEAPYLYERMGNHYRHFLVDEFQDTSRLQWQNLMPLVVEGLSEGNQSLAVGDGKQAIYRWRGGDVEQFVHFPRLGGSVTPIIQDRIKYLSDQLQERQLEFNYRSRKNVVNFNNQLFKAISSNHDELIRDIFSEVEQIPLDKNEGGLVGVKVYNAKENGDRGFDEYNFIEVLQCIRNAISQGYKFEDIAILTRSNSSLVKIVEDFQERAPDVPLISGEALLLFNSVEVRAIHTYLKLVVSPNDHHEQLHLLFLLNQLGLEFGDGFDIPKSILEHKSKENFELIMASLGYPISLDAQIRKSNIQVVEESVSDLRLGEKSNAFILTYLNEAYEFFKNGKGGLGEFLTYVEDKKDKISVSSSEGENAVSLMTIHKSKGLEFPFVVLPFADYRFNYGGRMWVELDSEEFEGLGSFSINKNADLQYTRFNDDYRKEELQTDLDELNVLYVACTRAVDELHIFTSNSSRKSLNKKILPALKELQGWENEYEFRAGEPVQKEKKLKLGSTDSFEITSMGIYPQDQRFNYVFPKNGDINNDLVVGNAVHATLAMVHYDKNLQDALRFADKLDIPIELLTQVKEVVHDTITNPSLKDFYSHEEVLIEREILSSKGEILRPDRMVKVNGQWNILDYKTGDFEEEHIEQLSKYKIVAQEVFGSETRGFLYYTQNRKLVEV